VLNLDTNMVVRAFRSDLTAHERRLLGEDRWGISAIVLWELAKLSQMGRIDVGLDDPEFSRNLQAMHVWPLDLEVARASTRLDFRSDPADEIIAATSIVHGAPLVTRDRKLLRSRVVPLA